MATIKKKVKLTLPRNRTERAEMLAMLAADSARGRGVDHPG